MTQLLLIIVTNNYSQVITLFFIFVKMEDKATWMYGLPRYSQAYADEVDKFITIMLNHAKTLSAGTNCLVICPCKDCKNHLATYDVEII